MKNLKYNDNTRQKRVIFTQKIVYGLQKRFGLNKIVSQIFGLKLRLLKASVEGLDFRVHFVLSFAINNNKRTFPDNLFQMLWFFHTFEFRPESTHETSSKVWKTRILKIMTM